jgi:MIP family channel proteins
MDSEHIHKYVAEMIGTFWLTFAGCGSAVIAAGFPEVGIGLLGVSLAFGLSVVTMAYAIGHVSGCHLNPAVTLGLAATGRFPRSAAAAYVGAQLAGGLLGALLTWAVGGGAAREGGRLGATVPAEGVSSPRAFLTEALVTFVLVLVVVSVATDERATGAVAPVAVGFALAAGIFVAGPLTGGAVNPARALGPDLLAGEIAPLWIYLLAPTLGGVLAAVVYDRVLAAAEPPG